MRAERFANRRAEAHVDDWDVVTLLVLDGPIDSVESCAGCAHAVAVKNFQIDQLGVGSDTRIVARVALRCRAVTGRRTRHASSVTITVAIAQHNTVAEHSTVCVRPRPGGGEVYCGNDARLVFLLKVWMASADATVNDGDRDALACYPGSFARAFRFRLGEVCASRLTRDIHLCSNSTV